MGRGSALQILSGKSLKDIPVVMNQKGQLYANLAIAKKLNVIFPLTTLKAIKVIMEQPPQITERSRP